MPSFASIRGLRSGPPVELLAVRPPTKHREKEVRNHCERQKKSSKQSNSASLESPLKGQGQARWRNQRGVHSWTSAGENPSREGDRMVSRQGED